MVDVADPHTAVTPVTLELSDLNRHDPAISLLQQAADGLLTVYGEQHPHTRTVERDLRKAQTLGERRGSSIDRRPVYMYIDMYMYMYMYGHGQHRHLHVRARLTPRDSGCLFREPYTYTWREKRARRTHADANAQASVIGSR